MTEGVWPMRTFTQEELDIFQASYEEYLLDVIESEMAEAKRLLEEWKEEVER